MSRGVVRGVGLLVVVIGLAMFLNFVLGWGFSQSIFNALRAGHLILALALVGLYEAAMARRKRRLIVAGRPVGLVGRITLTLALVLGFYLLLTHFVDALTGYEQIIWVHGVIGLIAYGLTEIALSGRRAVSR